MDVFFFFFVFRRISVNGIWNLFSFSLSCLFPCADFSIPLDRIPSSSVRGERYVPQFIFLLAGYMTYVASASVGPRPYVDDRNSPSRPHDIREWWMRHHVGQLLCPVNCIVPRCIPSGLQKPPPKRPRIPNHASHLASSKRRPYYMNISHLQSRVPRALG